MRHPRNKGERLALNRHLQVSGRDHRGRASKDQKIGTSIRRQTARKADMVEIELDYVFVTDPEPPRTALRATKKNFGGSTPPIFSFDGRFR